MREAGRITAMALRVVGDADRLAKHFVQEVSDGKGEGDFWVKAATVMPTILSILPLWVYRSAIFSILLIRSRCIEPHPILQKCNI